jgi:hypothetical protein
MAEVIKRSYLALLSKLGLNTLFWIVVGLAVFNLGYSYTLSLEIDALQGRTQVLETKVQTYQLYFQHTEPRCSPATASLSSLASDSAVIPTFTAGVARVQ